MGEQGPQSIPPEQEPTVQRTREFHPIRPVVETVGRVRLAAGNSLTRMSEGYQEHREIVAERRQARRERWHQFREDYAAGGGIRQGLQEGVKWGVLSAIGAGIGGGIVFGGAVDMIMYSANHANTSITTVPSTIASPDMYADNLFADPMVYVPLIIAAVSAIAAGGYAFYKGLMSPAEDGRRMRTGEYWYNRY